MTSEYVVLDSATGEELFRAKEFDKVQDFLEDKLDNAINEGLVNPENNTEIGDFMLDYSIQKIKVEDSSFDTSNEKDLAIALRKLLAEENDAVSSYIDKAKKLEDLGYSEISTVLLDIADEELVHIGELQALLDREGISSDEELIEGLEEVDKLEPASKKPRRLKLTMSSVNFYQIQRRLPTLNKQLEDLEVVMIKEDDGDVVAYILNPNINIDEYLKVLDWLSDRGFYIDSWTADINRRMGYAKNEPELVDLGYGGGDTYIDLWAWKDKDTSEW